MNERRARRLIDGMLYEIAPEDGANLQHHALSVLDPTAPGIRVHAGRVIRLRNRETLFNSEHGSEGLYRVLSGFVQTCMIAEDGRRLIRAFHVPGEILWISPGSVCNCVAEALCNSRVLPLENSLFKTLTGNDESAAEAIWTWLSKDIERSCQHAFLLARASALEKLSFFLLDLMGRLKDNSRLNLPMSRSEIGDYLGLTSETVTRTLTHLHDKGYVKVDSRRIEILNKEGLSRLAKFAELV